MKTDRYIKVIAEKVEINLLENWQEFTNTGKFDFVYESPNFDRKPVKVTIEKQK